MATTTSRLVLSPSWGHDGPSSSCGLTALLSHLPDVMHCIDQWPSVTTHRPKSWSPSWCKDSMLKRRVQAAVSRNWSTACHSVQLHMHVHMHVHSVLVNQAESYLVLRNGEPGRYSQQGDRADNQVAAGCGCKVWNAKVAAAAKPVSQQSSFAAQSF